MPLNPGNRGLHLVHEENRLPSRHFSWINDGMSAPIQYKRLLPPPRESFFLFGLRGAGKSTWARAHFPDALRIDLLDERLYQAIIIHKLT
jgi:hypothetical protein